MLPAGCLECRREALAADLDVGILGILVRVVAMGAAVGDLHEMKCFMRRRLRVDTGRQPSGDKRERGVFEGDWRRQS